jgi:hypothetical protein
MTTVHGILLILLSLASTAENVLAERIPSDIKQIVTFVYVEQEKPKDKAVSDRLSGVCENVNVGRPAFLCANGTAFFVGIPHPTNPDVFYVYLVTAKHVLYDQRTGSLYPMIVTRLNKRDGGVLRETIPLVIEGRQKNVYFHNDPTVDLAVIPHGWPKKDIIDGMFLPENLISDKASLKNLHIKEGTEVFFTGLFTPHIGASRNYPIFRFGHLALVTEEKVGWVGGMAELYLMETAAYGGNSGSPVFFFLDLDRPVPHDGPLRLAGVMSGAFQEVRGAETAELVEAAKQTRAMGLATNIGIAAIVPSYKLLEILHGKELEERRGQAQ